MKQLRLKGLSWKSYGPTSAESRLISKLDQDDYGFVQLSFEYLQGQRLHSLSREPVPGFNHPVNNVVLVSIWTTPCCNLCLLAFVLSLCTFDENLALSSLIPSPRLAGV